LVLDTEVYSNTGGQACKATPRGAIAKFAPAASTPQEGSGPDRHELRHVYVAMSPMAQGHPHLKTFLEAEAFDGRR